MLIKEMYCGIIQDVKIQNWVTRNFFRKNPIFVHKKL